MVQLLKFGTNSGKPYKQKIMEYSKVTESRILLHC